MVYNNNRDLAYFIIQCGARVKPWSWMQCQYLPEPLKQDKVLLNMIQVASSQPQKLILMCVNTVRRVLSRCEEGRSIMTRIDKLPCHPEIKKIVRFECATTKREQDIKKLHRFSSVFKFCNEFSYSTVFITRLQETTEV